MRHVAYLTKDDAEHLVIAIGNASSAEDSWFASGHTKTRLRLGADILSSAANPHLVQIVDSTAAISGRQLTSSTVGQTALHARSPRTFAALVKKNSLLSDDQESPYSPQDTDYYARLRLFGNATASTWSRRKWHFLRKKSRSFFKRKRTISTVNSRTPAAAIDDKVLLSESERRLPSDVTQNSKIATSATAAGTAALLCDSQDDHVVISDSAGDDDDMVVISSDIECDPSDELTSLLSETKPSVHIQSASRTTSRNVQLPPAEDSCEEDSDQCPNPIGRLQRSTSVPGIAAIPKLTINGVAYNPSAETSHLKQPPNGNNRLGKVSRSKIDLMPTFKSLVTMTTHKLASSRSSNLNYWPGATCNGHCGPSNNDVRKLRRYISLNNVTSGGHVDQDSLLKNASSQDINKLYPSHKKLKKSNTVSSLSPCTSSNGGSRVKPLRPINRLRPGSTPMSSAALSVSKIMCSRCSSILSMAASSRYSVNSNYGFVPLTSVNCKVCLNEVPLKDSWTLQHCECSYCVECVRSYVEFEINQGAYSISCPDAECEKQGIILLEEIESLVSLECVEKHKRYRLNREVEMDKSRTWCPQAGCETVCTLSSTNRTSPQNVNCPTCDLNFCSNCRHPWHEGSACKSEEAVPGVTFDSELIKCCPMCSVPIEKDEGCAQMLCKRCKHVFCWYCLASLDDDFLLRHYDKGPCKNKLGHSRASVIWHRTQVISIFAGFGILLLIASPLLLLAAPCIVCCRCRVCTSDSKLDSDDELPDPAELHLNTDTDSADEKDIDAILQAVAEDSINSNSSSAKRR